MPVCCHGQRFFRSKSPLVTPIRSALGSLVVIQPSPYSAWTIQMSITSVAFYWLAVVWACLGTLIQRKRPAAVFARIQQEDFIRILWFLRCRKRTNCRLRAHATAVFVRREISREQLSEGDYGKTRIC